ncbi:VOC family protein [Nocardia callitridis]|uniref:VOC family protein n=1 Tax=Nocardia callitridis TaxID=648753 RepID=A0ABP9KDK7_9NOCA
MSISPVRLNHAVLVVADLDRSVRFYTEVFNMELSSREPQLNAAFLRLPRSGNHHDLGLMGLAGATPPPARSVGLYHLGWQLDTIEELVELREILINAGAFTGESSHGATKSVYGSDPDGHGFEVMWMLPREAWGKYENAAVVEELDLRGEVAAWSGRRTAGEIVHESAVAPESTSRTA